MSISKLPNSEACIKVSVIIPVYKAEKYISETIVSLRRQTLKELEFIFIDDKGNDNSFNIIQESAKVDSRIILIQNNSNIGAGASRNKGIEIARGDFIAFMDSDDLLSPFFYEKLYNKAQQENLLVVKANVKILNKDGSKIIRSTNNHIKNQLTLFESMLCLHTSEHFSAIYSKEAIIKANAKYHESLRLGEDVFFLMTLMRTIPTKRFGIIDDVFYIYRMNENSITHSINTNTQKLSESLSSLHAKVNYLLDTDDSYDCAKYICNLIECFLYENIKINYCSYEERKLIYQSIDQVAKLIKKWKNSNRMFIPSRSIRLLQITLYNHTFFYYAMKFRLKLHDFKKKLKGK